MIFDSDCDKASLLEFIQSIENVDLGSQQIRYYYGNGICVSPRTHFSLNFSPIGIYESCDQGQSETSSGHLSYSNSYLRSPRSPFSNHCHAALSYEGIDAAPAMIEIDMDSRSGEDAASESLSLLLSESSLMSTSSTLSSSSSSSISPSFRDEGTNKNSFHNPPGLHFNQNHNQQKHLKQHSQDTNNFHDNILNSSGVITPNSHKINYSNCDLKIGNKLKYDESGPKKSTSKILKKCRSNDRKLELLNLRPSSEYIGDDIDIDIDIDIGVDLDLETGRLERRADNFNRDSAKNKSISNSNSSQFIDRVMASEGNKRGRKSLSAESTQVLRNWIIQNHSHPYPNQFEKEELAIKAKVTVKQVVDWMTNVRKRKLTPFLPKNKQAASTLNDSSDNI